MSFYRIDGSPSQGYYLPLPNMDDLECSLFGSPKEETFEPLMSTGETSFDWNDSDYQEILNELKKEMEPVNSSNIELPNEKDDKAVITRIFQDNIPVLSSSQAVETSTTCVQSDQKSLQELMPEPAQPSFLDEQELKPADNKVQDPIPGLTEANPIGDARSRPGYFVPDQKTYPAALADTGLNEKSENNFAKKRQRDKRGRELTLKDSTQQSPLKSNKVSQGAPSKKKRILTSQSLNAKVPRPYKKKVRQPRSAEQLEEHWAFSSLQQFVPHPAKMQEPDQVLDSLQFEHRVPKMQKPEQVLDSLKEKLPAFASAEMQAPDGLLESFTGQNTIKPDQEHPGVLGLRNFDNNGEKE